MKESLNTQNSSDVEVLEKQEQPVSVESKESSQEFAEKILEKIKKYMSSFLSKKEEIEKIENTISFEDQTIKEQIKNEINLDSSLDEIDNEIENTQTQASDNVNSVIRDFSKAYHHPEYRNKVAREIKEARNSGQDAEAVRSGFYDKTAGEKENFESQERERSVAEIMKEKDLVIVHAIPLSKFDRKSTPENNPVLKSNGYQDFKTSVEILSSLSPTISTSIPSAEKRNNGLYYPGGVILGEGKILAATSSDAGTKAHGLYKRISKYGGQETSIQSEINVDKVQEGRNYNELVVENPQVAGLFYNLPSDIPLENPYKEKWMKEDKYLSEEIAEKRWMEMRRAMEYDQSNRRPEIELNQMRKFSEELNVPLYIFKNENGELKKYRIKFLEKENDANHEYVLEEVTAKDIYESKRETSEEERNKMIEDIKNKGILSESAEKEVDKKFNTNI